MKLRRAMAAAAATAAIAPIALLSAPAAFATDTPGTSANSSAETGGTSSTDDQNATSGDGSTSTDDQNSTSGDDSTSTDDSSSSDDQNATSGDDSTSTDDQNSTSGDDSTSTDDQNSTSGDDSSSTDDQNSTSGDDGTSTDDGSTPSDDETTPSEDDDLQLCEALDKDFTEKALDVKVSALPGKIVAGSGWHSFTLKVTNDSDITLHDVAFYAEVESGKYLDEAIATGKSPKPILSKYVDLQYQNPISKTWKDIRDQDGLAGGYFWGTDTMKPGDFNKIGLRVNIHKDAPAGEAYHFGTGAYLDNVNGKDCIAQNWGDGWYFDILSAGSSNTNPGEAKPDGNKPSKTTPVSAKKPQGGVSEQPVSGSLAETGSSSMLPTIGLAGGVAVVAGAGAMFVVRRRKGAGSNAAA
ncbi:LAETG motif-containing sortase-dependent surface protein [Streptomyces sp. NPDC101225]|uniref:LAETG motif-containing sortase-dependent surface protein n=1 Tax=Streptomyces sp. NPDC101225 TaxID=3366135 RepID=UPI0037F14A80